MHTWNPQWIQNYFKKLKSKVVWDDSQLSYNDKVQIAVAWSEAGSRRGIHGTQVTSKFTVSIVLMLSQVHRNSHVYKTILLKLHLSYISCIYLFSQLHNKEPWACHPKHKLERNPVFLLSFHFNPLSWLSQARQPLL